MWLCSFSNRWLEIKADLLWKCKRITLIKRYSDHNILPHDVTESSPAVSPPQALADLTWWQRTRRGTFEWSREGSVRGSEGGHLYSAADYRSLFLYSAAPWEGGSWQILSCAFQGGGKSGTTIKHHTTQLWYKESAAQIPGHTKTAWNAA